MGGRIIGGRAGGEGAVGGGTVGEGDTRGTAGVTEGGGGGATQRGMSQFSQRTLELVV